MALDLQVAEIQKFVQEQGELTRQMVSHLDTNERVDQYLQNYAESIKEKIALVQAGKITGIPSIALKPMHASQIAQKKHIVIDQVKPVNRHALPNQLTQSPGKRIVKKVVKKVNPSTARTGRKKLVHNSDGTTEEIDVATEEEIIEEQIVEEEVLESYDGVAPVNTVNAHVAAQYRDNVNFANTTRGNTSLAYTNPSHPVTDRDHNLSEMRHLLQRMDRMAMSTHQNEQMAPMYNDLIGLKSQMVGLVDKIQTSNNHTLPYNHDYATTAPLYQYPNSLEMDNTYRQALLDQNKYLTDPLLREQLHQN